MSCQAEVLFPGAAPMEPLPASGALRGEGSGLGVPRCCLPPSLPTSVTRAGDVTKISSPFFTVPPVQLPHFPPSGAYTWPFSLSNPWATDRFCLNTSTLDCTFISLASLWLSHSSFSALWSLVAQWDLRKLALLCPKQTACLVPDAWTPL